MRIAWYLSDFWACGLIRGQEPTRWLTMIYSGYDVDMLDNYGTDDLFNYQVMIFQRGADNSMLEFMRRAKKMGIFCIYEIDDDLLHVPVSHTRPHKFFSNPDIRRNVKDYIAEASAITTPSAIFKTQLEGMTDAPVWLIPNGFDKTLFFPRNKGDRQTITIGYNASFSHIMDWPLVEDALSQLMGERSDLRLDLGEFAGKNGCGRLEKWFPSRVIKREWINYYALPTLMHTFDIGIAPLIPHQFNLVKSNLKWVQHSAMGLRQVLSDYGPFKDCLDTTSPFGETALSDNTSEGWYNALSYEIMALTDDRNENKTEDVQKSCLDRVDANYNMPRIAELWKEVYDRAKYFIQTEQTVRVEEESIEEEGIMDMRMRDEVAGRDESSVPVPEAQRRDGQHPRVSEAEPEVQRTAEHRQRWNEARLEGREGSVVLPEGDGKKRGNFRTTTSAEGDVPKRP